MYLYNILRSNIDCNNILINIIYYYVFGRGRAHAFSMARQENKIVNHVFIAVFILQIYIIIYFYFRKTIFFFAPRRRLLLNGFA